MRTRLALVASAALLATGLAVPTLAAEGPTTRDGCLASVPEPGSTEPVSICWSIHKPAGASADRPVPMVMHSHGWGGSRSTSASSFAPWLEKGFGILSFDQRGFGQSGGLAHVEDPDLEGKDVQALVDLVASLDWVAKEPVRGPQKGPRAVVGDDPVLGAIGGSYGGGYQFVGAFSELRDRGDTRFDALAPEITWWDLKESLAPDEVARSTWLTLLQAAGARDVPQEVNLGYAYGASTGLWPGAGNPVADLDAFFEENGPRWHVENGRQLDIPVLFGQGVTDNLFNLNQGLKNYDRALTPQARKKSIFVGYNGGHALPNVLPQGYGTAGDPCSEELGSPSFSDLAQRFMQAHLLGLSTGLSGQGVYHLATADGACATVPSVTPTAEVPLGTVATTSAVGGPVTYALTTGEAVRVAGQPHVKASVTSVGAHNRAFFALSVGTSPLDAKVIANNVMPLAVPLPVVGEERTFELPAVAVDVPAGQTLFLTVSPVSDMFAVHGSRVPGALVLQDAVVQLPVQATPRS